MTIEDLRLECGWSKSELARQAGINYHVLLSVYARKSVSMRSADKIVRAIGARLGRTILIKDVEDLIAN